MKRKRVKVASTSIVRSSVLSKRPSRRDFLKISSSGIFQALEAQSKHNPSVSELPSGGDLQGMRFLGPWVKPRGV